MAIRCGASEPFATCDSVLSGPEFSLIVAAPPHEAVGGGIVTVRFSENTETAVFAELVVYSLYLTSGALIEDG